MDNNGDSDSDHRQPRRPQEDEYQQHPQHSHVNPFYIEPTADSDYYDDDWDGDFDDWVNSPSGAATRDSAVEHVGLLRHHHADGGGLGDITRQPRGRLRKQQQQQARQHSCLSMVAGCTEVQCCGFWATVALVTLVLWSSTVPATTIPPELLHNGTRTTRPSFSPIAFVANPANTLAPSPTPTLSPFAALVPPSQPPSMRPPIVTVIPSLIMIVAPAEEVQSVTPTLHQSPPTPGRPTPAVP